MGIPVSFICRHRVVRLTLNTSAMHCHEYPPFCSNSTRSRLTRYLVATFTTLQWHNIRRCIISHSCIMRKLKWCVSHSGKCRNTSSTTDSTESTLVIKWSFRSSSQDTCCNSKFWITSFSCQSKTVACRDTQVVHKQGKIVYSCFNNLITS